MEITQEELDNMPPEDVAEVQKQQCIFCHIVEGKVSSKKVFEDDRCIGILDINPANPGHILLIPKEHYQIMPQVPDELIGHLFMVVKHLSQAALKALKVGGVNVIIANGIAAGQRAPHFMIHVIPRTEGDGLKFAIPQKQVTEKDLALLKNNIKPRINKIFGIEEVEPVDLDAKPEKIVVEAEFEDEQEMEPPEPQPPDIPEKPVEEVPEAEPEEQEAIVEPAKPDKQADLDRISELFS